MRRARTAAAALLGATTLLGLAATTATTASAKDTEPAWVSPAEAEPGQSVSVSVTCETSSEKTVTAASQAFVGGSTTLTVGPDGKYTGSAKVVAKEDLTAALVRKLTKDSSWGIDGKCPNGDTFAGAVSVAAAAAAAVGGAGAGPAEQPGTPHGGVNTGVGGSVATDGRQLVVGGALVAAGVGGFWMLRRREA
ncbi:MULTISPECIES: hypothetical protein [Kitasatospora]|uniref:Uncharacterized protein n=2 Tax=Kitasatospora TaxID=2063 RepID=A0ABT1IVD9_9ACTN|nr:hypothetical protein [Kitasatospora paracochleata]MCP2308561.1 hypothetical protein [Kitasatospora paracochleata]